MQLARGAGEERVATMSEQHPTSFPFAFPLGTEAVQKSLTDAQARWASALEDLTKVQAQGMAHTRMMVDESAKIAHATLDYWSQLGAEWRKAATEASAKFTGSNAAR